MTDYKNELRSVLYGFLGDYKDKRYLVQLKEGISRQRTRRTISRLRAKGKLYVPVNVKNGEK